MSFRTPSTSLLRLSKTFPSRTFPLRHGYATTATEQLGSKATDLGGKAGEAAKDLGARAQELGGKAGVAAARAGQVLGGIGKQVGDRAGGLLGAYRQPIVYNAQVARSILKQVYIAEKLAPPTSWSQVRGVYEQIYRTASKGEYWRELLRTGEWKRFGLYALEAYGIFSIWEMFGRQHMVGYKLRE